MRGMLTVKEAAAGVRLTQWAIYRAIQRGDLTAYKPGGRLRIYESDLEAWLQSTRTVRMLPPLAPDRAARRSSESGSLRARVRARRGEQAAT